MWPRSNVAVVSIHTIPVEHNLPWAARLLSLCLGPAVSASSLPPEWEYLIAGGFAWMCNNVGDRINPPARVPAVNSWQFKNSLLRDIVLHACLFIYFQQSGESELNSQTRQDGWRNHITACQHYLYKNFHRWRCACCWDDKWQIGSESHSWIHMYSRKQGCLPCIGSISKTNTS